MYGKKIRMLREEKNLTQKELAATISMNEDALSHYEREYLIIPLKHLIEICDFFEVSLDYIFDFNTERNYLENKLGYDKEVVGKRLREWRKDLKLTQVKLANVLNTVHPVIANYENGKNLIATPFLYTICSKYGVSADYLLGKIDDFKYLNKWDFR